LAGALWFFWLCYGYLNEGRYYLEGVLARSRGLGSRQARANVIAGTGVLAWLQGDNQTARLRLEESLALARELGAKRLIAEVLIYLGWVMLYQHKDDTLASVQFEESLTIARELGDKMGIAEVLTALGDLARERGDYGQAYCFFEESRSLYEELGAKGDVALALIVLGEVVRLQGDRVRARALFQDSLAQLRELGISRGFRIPFCLEELARLYATEGELEHATCLFGAAEALRELVGTPPLVEDEDIAAIRIQMSTGAFARAWAEGRAMAPEQAIEYALALPDVFEAAPPPVEHAPIVPSTYPAGLTMREVEVLRLLAHGLTYAQIADTLVITPRTVNAHLTSIYRKLGITSRVAATRFAMDHHLV
jgi:DNA-binding CsgD family transcriptional regulator